MCNACKKGYVEARVQSKRKNSNYVGKAYNVTKGVSKELYKNSSINDIPYIAAALGLLTPFPLASPVMFCIGKFIQICAKKLHNP